MSRFITYPSIVEKTADHTVMLVDATEQDQQRLATFLQISIKEFDVYFYESTVDDLQWASHVGSLADTVLINGASNMQTDSTRYGEGFALVDPLEYFEQIDVAQDKEKIV